jgi:uncharacterized protein (DUF427 family)
MADIRLADNGKPFESVWDFPRPPRVELVEWRIRVRHAGHLLVDAPRCHRVLETSQAPAYYVSPEHIDHQCVRLTERRSLCEWKGVASYGEVIVGRHIVPQAAWTYTTPTDRFAAIAGHWAFYAQALDECWVDDERVLPNDGNFYGGWVTANTVGPVKGAPGTLHW